MKPSIPVPCTEDWEKMKIGQFSRHCGSCRKNVMDFTQLSRHEILAYLIEHRGREVCGRILPSQLDFRHEDMLTVIGKLEQKHKNSNLSYYLLTMATLSLAACKSETNQVFPVREKQVKAEIKSEAKETVSEEIVEPKQVAPPVVVPPEVVMAYEEVFIYESKDTAFFNTLPEIKIRAEAYGDNWHTTGIVVYNHDPVYTADVMPEFKGGTEALAQYVKENIKYPRREKRDGIQGTVYASFFIDEKGRVSHPKILSSVEGGKNLDKAVIRLIKQMPDWTPAKNGNTNTGIYFNMPFLFELK